MLSDRKEETRKEETKRKKKEKGDVVGRKTRGEKNDRKIEKSGRKSKKN